MTAIVGVLNSNGIAVAADSAVTVTGNKVKKVYNRSNKIFTLSKIHPVGIAIYSSADFMGIPLETIIKLYRKKLKDDHFNTVEEYKADFLEFLKTQLTHVDPQLKGDKFYNFCFEAYNTIKNKTIDNLEGRTDELAALNPIELDAAIDAQITEEINAYQTIVNGFDKADYINKTIEEFTAFHNNQLTSITNFIQEEIRKKFPTATLKAAHITAVHELLFALINIEYLFENHSGLVFFGFGEEEIYPSTVQVLVGTAIADVPRVRHYDVIRIIPGVHNSNILPFAQGDVTTTVLTGVDPNYKDEMKQSIKSTFNTFGQELRVLLNNPQQADVIEASITNVSDELINKLEQYQFNTITGPLLEILAYMGKEDMSELAESLVNITSLKRKFTSSDSADESVGGPVDVAIVTKGDGFIWMKRKHYFDMENNQGFTEKYYKY